MTVAPAEGAGPALLFATAKDADVLRVFDAADGRALHSYGLWLHPLAPDRYRLYVTDNYELSNETVPPDTQLGERVRTWLLEVDRGARRTAKVTATFEGSFGETAGAGGG